MKYLSYFLSVAVTTMVLSACGSSTTTPAASTALSCAVGQVGTTSGCITSQGSCTVPGTSTIGALYNGQCLQITSTSTGTACSVAGQVSTQYGCITQNGTCTVQGTNQQGTWYNNICTPILSTGVYGSACTIAGQVQTQYGCIAQNGTCTVQGTNQQGTWYNNICTPITNSGVGGVNGAGGCYNTLYGYLCQQNCAYGQVLYNNQCYYLTNGNERMGGGYMGGAGFSFHLGL